MVKLNSGTLSLYGFADGASKEASYDISLAGLWMSIFETDEKIILNLRDDIGQTVISIPIVPTSPIAQQVKEWYALLRDSGATESTILKDGMILNYRSRIHLSCPSEGVELDLVPAKLNDICIDISTH